MRALGNLRRVAGPALLALTAVFSVPASAAEPAQPGGAVARATVIVVAGAPGESEYLPDFVAQAESWALVSVEAGARHVDIGRAPVAGLTDHDRLQQALAAEPKDGAGELWLVLVGHGSFDGKEAKLNLVGPDVSATELAEWLKPFRRQIAMIDTTSSSAPFMAKLAAPNRVIVTSTRSGYEQNYARFGKFLAEALPDPKSDLDKDGQISLLEAFLSASHRTTEYYNAENRLATEHALIDDTGDGLGTPSEWFRGVRATKKATDNVPLDGARAHQFHLVRSRAEQQLPPDARARRDALELEIAKLRDAKATMPEEAYYRELEQRMLALAAIYDAT